MTSIADVVDKKLIFQLFINRPSNTPVVPNQKKYPCMYVITITLIYLLRIRLCGNSQPDCDI